MGRYAYVRAPDGRTTPSSTAESQLADPLHHSGGVVEEVVARHARAPASRRWSAGEDVAASPAPHKKAAKKAAGDHAAALSPPPQEACVIVHGCKPSSCDGVAHSARVIDSTDRRNVLVELVCAHRPKARPWFTHVAWARLIKDTW